MSSSDSLKIHPNRFLQLMCFVDRGLIGFQRGLVESALEAQSVTSGDPGLYKVYVDLHWREWWRQTLHRGLALLIIMGILTMGLGVGAKISMGWRAGKRHQRGCFILQVGRTFKFR